MRFRLILHAIDKNPALPINYQYPLSAVIYKILEKADSKYAAFLHGKGYGQGLKNFKLFTFSDLKTPFKINGDRINLLSRKAELIVSFHLPQAAEIFIKGIFQSQQIEIADKKSRAIFQINQIESLAGILNNVDDNEETELMLKPLSPLVCGSKNDRGNYDFLSPENERFTEMIFLNWKEKTKAVFGEEQTVGLMGSAFIQTVFFKNPPKSRLVTIKANTDSETKIRGFTNFTIKIKGRKEAVELLLNAGVGLYNAQGMGCVEITQ